MEFRTPWSQTRNAFSYPLLIFVTSFMILSGIQIILASKVDATKIFVVGVAFVFGLSLDPGLYAGITGWMRLLFSSSLTLATVIAVVLNQVLRLRPAAAPAAESH